MKKTLQYSLIAALVAATSLFGSARAGIKPSDASEHELEHGAPPEISGDEINPHAHCKTSGCWQRSARNQTPLPQTSDSRDWTRRASSAPSASCSFRGR